MHKTKLLWLASLNVQKRVAMAIPWTNTAQDWCDNLHKYVNSMTENCFPTGFTALLIIVRSHWEDPKKNLNNFAILHPILMQLAPIDSPWKCAYYTKNLLLYNLRKLLKPNNCPLSKAYHRVVSVPYIVSTFRNVHSMWLLHDHIRDCPKHLQALNYYNLYRLAGNEKSAPLTALYLRRLYIVGSEIPKLSCWSGKHSYHETIVRCSLIGSFSCYPQRTRRATTLL